MTAISHLQVDWSALTEAPAKDAAVAIRELLNTTDRALGDAEKMLSSYRESIFVIRVAAFRLVERRQLWKLYEDEHGPYKSMFGFLQGLYPNDVGLRYALEANAVQRALPNVAIPDLLAMKRCNAVKLASVSESCRSDPAMIEAAKTCTEKEFVQRLNQKHHQHLEVPETRKFVGKPSEWAEIDEYLAWVAEKGGLDPSDTFAALLYLAVNENEEHRVSA